MRPWETLTGPGRTRRLRALALHALDVWGLEPRGLTCIGQSENTTWSADVAPDPRTEARGSHHVAHRVLIRVHRDGYQTPATIEGELTWIAALAEAGLPVQLPIPLPDGSLTTKLSLLGIPQPRSISILLWVDGERIGRRPLIEGFRAIGALTRRLHDHARTFALPKRFGRRHLSPDAFIPGGADPLYDAVEQDILQAGEVRLISRIIDSGHVFYGACAARTGATGLLHADLHTSNVLLVDGEARPLDFDDTGHGPWSIDPAVTLEGWVDHPSLPRLRRVYWEGYGPTERAHEALETEVDHMVAVRTCALLLWLLCRLDDHELYRKVLDRRKERYIRRLVRWDHGERLGW